MRTALRVQTAAPSLAAIALLVAGCVDRGTLPTVPTEATAPTAAGPALTRANAGPPQAGGGAGAITGLVITASRAADGNTIQERRITGTIGGTLEGTFVEEVRGVIHPDGHVTFQGTLTFAGVIPSCGPEAGTLTVGLSGQGQTGLPVTEVAFRTIDQAASTLAVTGTGTLRQAGPALTYEVRYVCH
jgi:hypothetical protein